ncbi:hypothetical protein OPV22_006836 [Ensete ventricosum]|uniref:Uncharacterized protein n=1 Tax=Ensete ventricosum TaxID=4639 RepID=A0AAV8RTY4_ENSVE|nr:hypothetical protein OPV22_006836 [Ensete ventricosum]
MVARGARRLDRRLLPGLSASSALEHAVCYILKSSSFLFSDQENAVKASILRIMGRLQKSCFLTENLNEEDIRSVGALEWPRDTCQFHQQKR